MKPLLLICVLAVESLLSESCNLAWSSWLYYHLVEETYLHILLL